MNEIRVKFIKCEDMIYIDENYYYSTYGNYKKYIFASTKELTDLEGIALARYYCHVVNNESGECRTETKVVSLEDFKKISGPTYVLIQEKETDKEYKAFIE